MIEQKDLCDYGLSGSGALGAYVRNKQNIQELLILAQDAAMQTSPNIAVPAVLTSYIDTAVTNVLFDPRNATKLAREVKAGSWTTSTYIFRVAEGLGYIAPYGDFSPNGRSDVNYNFPRREQAKFQTVIEYGDFEEELLAEAKINYIADKQRAAALTVSIASNYFYLYGVKGMEVYGYLNDPNLNAAIAASPTGTDGGIKWSTKDTLAIYNDILTLFAELVNQNKNITANYKIKLALSPSCNVELGKATQYNISVKCYFLFLTRHFTHKWKNSKLLTKCSFCNLFTIYLFHTHYHLRITIAFFKLWKHYNFNTTHKILVQHIHYRYIILSSFAKLYIAGRG